MEPVIRRLSEKSQSNPHYSRDKAISYAIDSIGSERHTFWDGCTENDLDYAKVEAAANAGIKRILVPNSNLNDVLIEDEFKGKIEVIPVETLTEVIEKALIGKGKTELLKKLKALKPLNITGKVELESEKKITAAQTETKQKWIFNF